MPMGPAEIVASLKELCEAKGPRLSTGQIVNWIDRNGGYDSDAELIAYALITVAATWYLERGLLREALGQVRGRPLAATSA